MPGRDNWGHRSGNMTCANCMWYVQKSDTILGRCRRRAPDLGGWPAVFCTDWCGDHKLDEGTVQSLAVKEETRDVPKAHLRDV